MGRNVVNYAGLGLKSPVILPLAQNCHIANTVSDQRPSQ